MNIDTQTIMKVREMTGAGISDVKSALEDSGGDIDKAIEILRKKGTLKAAKKSAERSANQGRIESYIHSNGRAGALVELRCETDFVARNENFKQLAHDLALHIVASSPQFIKIEDIPSEILQKEKEIYREQLKAEGKPKEIVERIIEGKLEKFYQDVVLLRQPYVKDDSITIKDLIDQNIAKIGEKIEIVSFSLLSF